MLVLLFFGIEKFILCSFCGFGRDFILERLSVLVKLHFSKLVAAFAKRLCYFRAVFVFPAQLGILHGSVEDVGSVALSEVRNVDGKIKPLLFADVCKENESLVKSLKLGKISVR